MKSIGKYQLNKALGSGYFGTTYQAIDEISGQTVAVKVIKKHWFNKDWFKREVKPLMSLSHPNIVQYIECNYVGEGGSRVWYIVTELANQGTLRERMNSGGLSKDLAIQHAIAILDGLQVAHTAGIIHNDLKPENLLLHDGCIKIADFGISIEAMQTVVGNAGGTPKYMAPERYTRSEMSTRSDLWAIGIILYEMLAGRLPFATTAELIAYNPTSHDLERDGIPTELSAVLSKALSNEKANRFHDAQAFREALNQATIKEVNVMRAEQGVVGWDWDGKQYAHRKFRIDFKQPFQMPPIVELSVMMLDLTGNNATRYWCTASEVRQEHAEIEIGTWGGSQLKGAKISWTALGT